MLFLYSFILLFPLLSNGFIHEKNKRRLLHHHHYHHHHSFDQSSLFRSSPTVLSLSHSEDDDASNSYDEEDMTSSSGPRRRRPTRVRPVRPTAATQKMETRREEAKARHKEALQDPTLLTLEKFSDRRDIHPATKRAITEVLGLQAMTEIQAKTYAAVIAGQSVLGRARTGTGKTLAFLIPAVERLLEADLDLYKPGRTIGVIVIAPTRELAIQIAVQTDALLTFHHDMDVACIYGGTKIQRDLRLLTGPRMPSILVTTPGRLLEHLENDTRLGRRSFCRVAEETRMIVLDEADRLLDGFSKETMKILSFLPRVEKRQNLLFSATISNKLRGFLKGSMKIDFTEVNCVDGSDIQSETNARVNQTYLMLDEISQYIQTLVSILTQVMKEDNYKVLVFFPASKVVRFLANFFNEGLGVSVLEIHSRMSQSSRNRASNAFRSARRGILFSSDVSARGTCKFCLICFHVLWKPRWSQLCQPLDECCSCFQSGSKLLYIRC